MKRFTFIQHYNEYTDYDTVLGNLTEDELTDDERINWASENLRRLTFVNDDVHPRYAYVIHRDGTDRRITWEEGIALLGHEPLFSTDGLFLKA